MNPSMEGGCSQVDGSRLRRKVSPSVTFDIQKCKLKTIPRKKELLHRKNLVVIASTRFCLL